MVTQMVADICSLYDPNMLQNPIWLLEILYRLKISPLFSTEFSCHSRLAWCLTCCSTCCSLYSAREPFGGILKGARIRHMASVHAEASSTDTIVCITPDFGLFIRKSFDMTVFLLVKSVSEKSNASNLVLSG